MPQTLYQPIVIGLFSVQMYTTIQMFGVSKSFVFKKNTKEIYNVINYL